jgi:hypothetical protein
MPSALIVGIDVQGDKELSESFRVKGSAFQRTILAHVKQLGSSARALARGQAYRATGKSAASIYSRVSVSSAGTVTLKVRPGKVGWTLAFNEFPQKTGYVHVKPYNRRPRGGASIRPVMAPIVNNAGRRGSREGQRFKTFAGYVHVGAHDRAVGRLVFKPALTQARDYIEGNMVRVMREAVTEALEAR